MAITKIQAGALPADVITTAAIDDASVTHAKLHTTMDLSSKTVTLPSLSQTIVNSSHIQMGGNLDVVGQIGAYDNPGSSWGTMILRATDFEFKNAGGTIKMALDTSGNVGIGETAPLGKLHVKNGDSGATADVGADELVVENNTHAGITILSGQSYNGSIYFGDAGVNYDGFITYGQGTRSMVFGSAAGTRMTLDSSGHLLVGKSVTTQSTPGTVLYSSGQIYNTASGTHPLVLTRNTNDGALSLFYKDTNEVGRIAANGGSIIVGSGNTGLYFDDGSDRLIPVDPVSASGRDNAVNLGGGSERFKDLYLSGGVYLGGTGSANKLDDYEEGTWTLTQGAQGTWNSPTFVGKYTKIGQLVTVTIEQNAGTISYSKTYYGGLPFPVNSSTHGYKGVGSASNGGLDDLGGIMAFSGTTQIYVLTSGSNQTNLIFSITYHTDS